MNTVFNIFDHMFPTDHCRLMSIFHRNEDGAPSTYNGHLSFDVAFNCNTLTRCVRLWLERMTFKMFFVQSGPPLQTLPCEVSYVYQSV